MSAPRPLTERLRATADGHARVLGPGRFGNCFYGSGTNVRLLREAADRIETLTEALTFIADYHGPATYVGTLADGTELYGTGEDIMRFAREALGGVRDGARNHAFVSGGAGGCAWLANGCD